MFVNYSSPEEEYLDSINTRASKALCMLYCFGAELKLVRLLLKYKTNREVMDDIAPLYQQMSQEMFGQV